MLNRKSLMLLTAALALSACVAVPDTEDVLTSSIQACTTENLHYIDAWGCFQGRYAMGQISDSDPRLKAFLKLGDDLGRQVESKKLPEANAKQRLLAGLATGVT